MTHTSPPVPPHVIVLATSMALELDVFEQILQRYSFRLYRVSRGDQAMSAAMAGGVALMLLDVTLAGSASFELCRRLRQPAMPVFLLSATPSDEEALRAAEAGAAAYLPLPFQADELAGRILMELGVINPPAAMVGNPRLADLQVNYHSLMAGSPDVILLLDRDDKRVLDLNRNARKLFGLTEAELLNSSLFRLCPPLQPDGVSSKEWLAGRMAQVMAGDVRTFEMVLLHSSGRAITAELRMVPLDVQDRRLLHVRLVDITARKQAEQLYEGKNLLLEMVARGAPLQQTLEGLIRLIEARAEGVLCTVLLLDPDGRTVRPAAGPGMPPAYLAALDGLAIGPEAGSCGTAMYRKATVVVSDIQADPLWAPYRELAAAHGLRACWAMPILYDTDTVLGSFAMYYREVRSPTAADRRLIGTASHLAGIAIARTRRDEELARHRSRLEELVQERTAELRQAKEEAEHANEELSTALSNLSMTQDELVRRDKLAALGSLVAGVAHELNTPIGNSLVMASSMSERTAALRREVAGGLRRSVLEQYLEQAAEADEVVVRNLRRAAELVSGFKQIAIETGSAQRRRFLLDELVGQQLLPLHAGACGLALDVVLLIDPGLEMDSYPAALGQALGHLFDNSVLHGLAGRERGAITVRAYATASGEICLSFGDDGAGIPAANLARIYDPFFTTRLGEGSGLGLYIIHNIVTGVLGGRIDVHSTEGKGTTFILLLPPVAPL
ncbi:ATP-binding protein [Oxalobacteraceae bacterium A2-2]